MSSPLYLGLISGTSMDGVDCVLAAMDHDRPTVLHHASHPLPDTLKTDLLKLCTGSGFDLPLLGNADFAVGKVFAQTVNAFLDHLGRSPDEITAIGSHGQTVWHQPPRIPGTPAFTLQIGDPNIIAQDTGITTIADFRRRDMAAGGQGAPIVPALHQAIFQKPGTDRIVLNLGGIANITFLPGDMGTPLGFDTGPANVLMDGWIGRHQGKAFDASGIWAASSAPDQKLLECLFQEAYFTLPAPKSTGRELFNLAWLDGKLAAFGNLDPAVVQASLLELTAESVARDIDKLMRNGEVLVCGGGASNAALLKRLQDKLPGRVLTRTSEHGLHEDFVEAAAFAWFASRTLQRIPTDFSAFTGARGAVIAGGVYYA